MYQCDTHLVLDHVAELLYEVLLRPQPLDDLGLLHHLALVTGPPVNNGVITLMRDAERCYDAKIVTTLRRILIMIIMMRPCGGN